MRANCSARFESGFILTLWSLQYLRAYNPSTTAPPGIHLTRRSLSSTVTRAVDVEEHSLNPSLAEEHAGTSSGNFKRGFDLNLSPERLFHEEIPAGMTDMSTSAYAADEELPHRPPGTTPQAMHPQITHDYLGAASAATSEHPGRYPTREFLPTQPGGVRTNLENAYPDVDSPNYLSLGRPSYSSPLQENVRSVPQHSSNVHAAIGLDSLLGPLTLGATETHQREQVPAGGWTPDTAHHGFGPVATIPGSHVPAGDSPSRIIIDLESPPAGTISAAPGPLKPSTGKPIEDSLRLNDQQLAAAPGAASSIALQATPRAEFDPAAEQQIIVLKDSKQRLDKAPVPSNVNVVENPLSFSHNPDRAPPSQLVQKIGGEEALMETDSTSPHEQESPKVLTVPRFEELWEKACQSPPKNTEPSDPVVEPRLASESRTNLKGDRPMPADSRLGSSMSQISDSDSPLGQELPPAKNYYTRMDKKSRPLVEHAHEGPSAGLAQSHMGEEDLSRPLSVARQTPDADKSPSPASPERGSESRETIKSGPIYAAERSQSGSAPPTHEAEPSSKSRDSPLDESSAESHEQDTSDEDYSGTEHIEISDLPIKTVPKTRKMTSVAMTSSRPVSKSKEVNLHSEMNNPQSSDAEIGKKAPQSSKKSDKGKEMVGEKRKTDDVLDKPELQPGTQTTVVIGGDPLEGMSRVWNHEFPPWHNDLFQISDEEDPSVPENAAEERQARKTRQVAVASASSSPSEATMQSSKRPKTIKIKPISSSEAQKPVSGGSKKSKIPARGKSKKKKQQAGPS